MPADKSLRNFARAMTLLQLPLLAIFCGIWLNEKSLALALLNGLPPAEESPEHWREAVSKLRRSCIARILNQSDEDWIPMVIELQETGTLRSIFQQARLTSLEPECQRVFSDRLVERLLEKCPKLDRAHRSEIYLLLSIHSISSERALQLILKEMDRVLENCQSGADCNRVFGLTSELVSRSGESPLYQRVIDWVRRGRQSTNPWRAMVILSASLKNPKLAAEVLDEAILKLPPMAHPMLRIARLNGLFWLGPDERGAPSWDLHRKKTMIEKSDALLRGMSLAELSDLSLLDFRHQPLVAACLEDRLRRTALEATSELEWQVSLWRLAMLIKSRIERSDNPYLAPEVFELSFRSGEEWIFRAPGQGSIAAKHDVFYEQFVTTLAEMGQRDPAAAERTWIFNPSLFEK